MKLVVITLKFTQRPGVNTKESVRQMASYDPSYDSIETHSVTLATILLKLFQLSHCFEIHTMTCIHKNRSDKLHPVSLAMILLKPVDSYLIAFKFTQ